MRVSPARAHKLIAGHNDLGAFADGLLSHSGKTNCDSRSDSFVQTLGKGPTAQSLFKGHPLFTGCSEPLCFQQTEIAIPSSLGPVETLSLNCSWLTAESPAVFSSVGPHGISESKLDGGLTWRELAGFCEGNQGESVDLSFGSRKLPVPPRCAVAQCAVRCPVASSLFSLPRRGLRRLRCAF